MTTPQDVIDLGSSDEESIDLSAIFFTPPRDFDPEFEAIHLNNAPQPPSSTHVRLDPYPACLAEILSIFPDIALDHVRLMYDKHVQAAGPVMANENDSTTAQALIIAQALIGEILDGGRFPKEKERAKELKRKRTDRSSDEEEAARWKNADPRHSPLAYSKIA